MNPSGMPRRLQIFQFPNRPLMAALVCGIASRLIAAPLDAVADLVSRLALLVWSIEEILSGANWVRRMFGIAGGVLVFRAPRASVGSRGGQASEP